MRCSVTRAWCGIEKLDATFWKSAVRAALRIAGLLHDMAYPDVMSLKVRHAAEPATALSPYDRSEDEECRRAVEYLAPHLVPPGNITFVFGAEDQLPFGARKKDVERAAEIKIPKEDGEIRPLVKGAAKLFRSRVGTPSSQTSNMEPTGGVGRAPPRSARATTSDGNRRS